MARGAIAVALTLSVGAYALTVPSLADVTATKAADAAAELRLQAQREADAAADAALIERRAAVVEVADDVAARAQLARETATAASVTPEVVAPLEAAVAELGVLLELARTEGVDTAAVLAGDPAGNLTPGSATPAPASTSGTRESAPAALPADAPAVPFAAPTAPAPAPAGTPAAVSAAEALSPAPVPTTVAGVSVPSGPEDETTSRLRAVVEKVADASAQVVLVAEANVAASQAAAEIQAAADAEAQRIAAEQAATRAAWRTSLDDYANGRIPDSALCDLGFDSDHELRCDATEQLELLDAAYLDRFGVHLTISDSYRSYAGQVACRYTKGNLCATPGTSNHGLGTAVDLGGGIQTFGTRQHVWMVANAERYGWTLPSWARASGSKPEAWHWEFVG